MEILLLTDWNQVENVHWHGDGFFSAVCLTSKTCEKIETNVVCFRWGLSIDRRWNKKVFWGHCLFKWLYGRWQLPYHLEEPPWNNTAFHIPPHAHLSAAVCSPSLFAVFSSWQIPGEKTQIPIRTLSAISLDCVETTGTHSGWFGLPIIF